MRIIGAFNENDLFFFTRREATIGGIFFVSKLDNDVVSINTSNLTQDAETSQYKLNLSSGSLQPNELYDMFITESMSQDFDRDNLLYYDTVQTWNNSVDEITQLNDAEYVQNDTPSATNQQYKTLD